jgi:intracellular multiplication protein IcmV
MLTRLNLTEQDIQKRQLEFRRLLILYVACAVFLFCYAFYLAWQRSVHGATACFVITIVSLTQVFRYHFWMFQLKKRKLGCTFREWWDSNLIGGNGS